MKDYTAATSNATNTITAKSNGSSATIGIEVNGTAHQNGTPAAWQSGNNAVIIVVANGDDTETYTVTVTKS